MSEQKVYRVVYDRGRTQITVRRSLDYTAFVVGSEADSIHAIGFGPEVTIPSASGTADITELFAALMDVWSSAYPGEEPDLLYIDFGDNTAEGFAALKLTEDSLRGFDVEETTVEALGERALTPLAQMEQDYARLLDRLREEPEVPVEADWGEAHIRELLQYAHADRNELVEALRMTLKVIDHRRVPWDIDRDEVVTKVDTPDGPKHIVAALFDFADRVKDEGNAGFEGHIMALHAARYIQWLEDELHRYTVQPVDNEIAVEGETYERWDENEARKLAYKTEHEEIHEILELAEHLGHALTVLDANRVWRVKANRETTRLGHWNLKLREALAVVGSGPIQSSCSDDIVGYGCQACPDNDDDEHIRDESHHPDCIVGKALAGVETP